jgi:Uri superfamily endonuclease
MLPDQPGTYVLILRLASSTTIQVGRLGSFHFPSGWYAYVGSGWGPGGLAARITRHLCSSKSLRWHIDYLCACAEPVEAWYGIGIRDQECAWAETLAHLSGTLASVPHFGASDCRCPGHLLRFAAMPSREAFAQAVGVAVACSRVPGAQP